MLHTIPVTVRSHGEFLASQSVSKLFKRFFVTFQRLDLSIDFGHDKEYYDQLVKDQNMEPLNLEVRKINDEMIL